MIPLTAATTAVRIATIGWPIVHHAIAVAENTAISTSALPNGSTRNTAFGETNNAHSNTAEGYFAILKRGIIGTYHHVSEAHLGRYLAEFDFRYSNRSKLGVEDAERAERALKGIVGKRLTYRRTNEAANA